MDKRKRNGKTYIISYICMETELSRRKYDFIIVNAKNIEDARTKFYDQLLEDCWMVQVLTIKLASEVLNQAEYNKIKRDRLNGIETIYL